jgi:RecG-like helicase
MQDFALTDSYSDCHNVIVVAMDVTTATKGFLKVQNVGLSQLHQLRRGGGRGATIILHYCKPVMTFGNELTTD